MSFYRSLSVLRNGGVTVAPTDTLYGLLASARNPEAVERVYTLKERDTTKPCIILVSDLDEITEFHVELPHEVRMYLSERWPSKLSVLLQGTSETPQYLHRGTGTLAFRMPDHEHLWTLLRETGPLVAPSANIQGEPPAESISDARRYFGDGVDLYIDGGEVTSEPSTLICFEGNSVCVIREGAVQM